LGYDGGLEEAEALIARATKRHPHGLMRPAGLRISLARWCWLSLLLAACCMSSRAARSHSLVGQKAPAFHFKGIFQEPYALETFRGHILVMQFSTSW
jgi:hypothetical protein